jgi:uroporphyrinogen-III synthase
MNLLAKNQSYSLLITRPIETAHLLAKEIEHLSLGFKSVIFPAIQIKDTINKKNSQLIFEKLSKHHYQFIIFISPLAVEKFAKQAQQHHFLLSPQMSLFCVGKDTASAIYQRLSAAAVFPEENYNSEALLALKDLQEVAGKKILICQGKGGNPNIHHILTQRAATVDSFILYERTLPKSKQLPDLTCIDLIICTSQESLINLIKLFKDPIKNKLFLFSSEKLKALGEQLGLKYPPILVKHAGNEAILEALRYFDLKKRIE